MVGKSFHRHLTSDCSIASPPRFQHGAESLGRGRAREPSTLVDNGGNVEQAVCLSDDVIEAPILSSEFLNFSSDLILSLDPSEVRISSSFDPPELLIF
jgi:hypothetical protein